jgi:hypothetical protein
MVLARSATAAMIRRQVAAPSSSRRERVRQPGPCRPVPPASDAFPQRLGNLLYPYREITWQIDFFATLVNFKRSSQLRT